VPKAWLKTLSRVLVVSGLLAGCTLSRGSHQGVELYGTVQPKARYSYAFPDQAPAELVRLLDLSLAHWNASLGAPRLFRARDFASADVKILYTVVETTGAHPAHTELLGCMGFYRDFTDCRIQLKIPKTLDTAEAMAPFAHLFNQGPLDAKLYEGQTYETAGDYLKAKLVLMSLTHEIGHTLGLGHVEDESCLMAEAPDGGLGFCEAELEAARLKLSQSTPSDTLTAQ
jgi:hypothetical protein